jgi:hypothetical protein
MYFENLIFQIFRFILHYKYPSNVYTKTLYPKQFYEVDSVFKISLIFFIHPVES